MTERLSVSVAPPHNDLLTVEDAFNHILEHFELAARSSDVKNGFVWRLVSAKMESPFTVVAEAVSLDPEISDIDVGALARAQKHAFANNIVELRKGKIPDEWSTGRTRRFAEDVLSRYEKVGPTIIRLDLPDEELAEIIITPEDAKNAVVALGELFVLEPTRLKEQIGSIEGYMMEVGTFYKKPAIKIRERKTNDQAWCVVPDEFRAEIADKATFDDVWSNRRILIRGRIIYESSGEISRIIATEIKRVDTTFISTDKIKDKDFTGGLSVAEYLEKLREGDLG